MNLRVFYLTRRGLSDGYFFANTKNKISVPEEPLKSVFQGHVVSHSVGVIPPAPFQKLQPVCSGCRQERVRSLQTS